MKGNSLRGSFLMLLESLMVIIVILVVAYFVYNIYLKPSSGKSGLRQPKTALDGARKVVGDMNKKNKQLENEISNQLKK